MLEQACELLDGLARPAPDRLGSLAAERVLDDEERQARDPERAELTHGEPLERGRRDEPGRCTGLRQLHRVVETPRRARPSVGRAREDHVARLRQLREHLGRCGRRGVRLPATDDRLHPVLGTQKRANLVRQPVEVHLGVVEEADGAALEGRRQRRHSHRFPRRLADRAQDANACHDLLRVTPVDRASSRPRLSCSSARIERLIETLIDSTGSELPARWMTSVPVNSCARSSVDARPLSVRTSQVSTMGAILPPMVIALDVGTSSTRASLYDSAGHPIPGRMRQVPYEPTVTPDGGVEHDATRLLEAVAACLDGVLAGHKAPIRAVAVTTFWHGLLGFDGRGHPVTPISMRADTRSVPDARLLGAALDDAAVHARTGCHLHASYWPAKLRWLSRERPAEIRRVARWASFGEHLELKMFGEASTSVSMASATRLPDQPTARWDPEALAAAEIDEARLFPLRDWTEARRGLRAPWAIRWPALRGVEWLPAVGDGAAGNIGADCLDPSRVALNVGTSAALRVVTTHPPEPRRRPRRHPPRPPPPPPRRAAPPRAPPHARERQHPAAPRAR